jgi:hypothetical protein
LVIMKTAIVFALLLVCSCGGQIGDSSTDVGAAGTGVDLTDEASCVAAGDALDACFAQGGCRTDVGVRLLTSCKGLIPWWPCMGAASYDTCVKAEARR